jgi:hypothetical protein
VVFLAGSGQFKVGASQKTAGACPHFIPVEEWGRGKNAAIFLDNKTAACLLNLAPWGATGWDEPQIKADQSSIVVTILI